MSSLKIKVGLLREFIRESLTAKDREDAMLAPGQEEDDDWSNSFVEETGEETPNEDDDFHTLFNNLNMNEDDFTDEEILAKLSKHEPRIIGQYLDNNAWISSRLAGLFKQAI